MCKVFSSDGTGDMTFEDFLDMMSVFSDNAPKNVKVEYAFRIYDFDNDDMLSNSDLEEVGNVSPLCAACQAICRYLSVYFILDLFSQTRSDSRPTI